MIFQQISIDGAGLPKLIMGGISVPYSITISAPIPSSNRIYTLQDAGTNANFVLSEGTQIVNAPLTLTQNLTVPGVLLATTGGIQ